MAGTDLATWTLDEVDAAISVAAARRAHARNHGRQETASDADRWLDRLLDARNHKRERER